MTRPYRVVQWATGNIGTRALRHVIRDPRLELVGVRVYDAAKDGVDAGMLCGEPETGVRASTDSRQVLDLEADCVLYMPRSLDLDDVVALLESGKNVVSTATGMFDGGRALPDDQRARVLEACERGGTSVYSTGSSPGFSTEVLPLALLTLQREVKSVAVEEFADLSQRNSPELLFRQMGFSTDPASFDTGRFGHLLHAFSPSLRTIAAAAGRTVEDWTCKGEVAVTPRDVTIPAGLLPAGTVAATRTRVSGWVDGSELVSFTASWYCSPDVEPAWDLQSTGWRVTVEGDAPLRVELPFPVAHDALGQVTPGYTANPAVNAIPYVCAATPGFLRTEQLPPLRPAGPLT